MRSHVFTDRELAKHAGRFVWLSIDTEKEQNAGFLERFPIESWPTLFVIDPSTETAALRWLGSATVPQLEKLLEDGERAIRGADEGSAEAALARADRLNGERKAAEAAEAYRAALAQAPADWPKRARAVESLLGALYAARAPDACARAAREHAPSLPRGPSFANAVALGLACTLSIEPPERDASLSALEPLAAEAVKLPGILADDRSGLYELQLAAREARRDEAGVRALAAEWLTFLEQAASAAKTPEARAAFDPHRVSAALALGDPARAIPALEQTEKDLPDDYNAPARLAVLYRELGRLDEALDAIDRALAKVYGPRKVRLLETKAGLQEKKGDRAGARSTLQLALSHAQSLPSAQRSPRTIERVEAALKRLSEPTP